MNDAPLLAARDIRKSFGAIEALSGVSLTVHAGQVTCLLGDNGAGKSTLIKIISGVMQPDKGEIRLAGVPVTFRSARDALDRGIATVYQDLAVVPIMPIYRNFFLGREPEIGGGIFRRLDKQKAMHVASEEISRIGIEVGDVRRPIQTLSGGERQSVAIARAITSALACSSSTSRHRRLASKKQRLCCAIFAAQRRAALASSLSPITSTTPISSAIPLKS
jgi:simple sugar transport system ATP-binding protein